MTASAQRFSSSATGFQVASSTHDKGVLSTLSLARKYSSNAIFEGSSEVSANTGQNPADRISEDELLRILQTLNFCLQISIAEMVAAIWRQSSVVAAATDHLGCL